MSPSPLYPGQLFMLVELTAVASLSLLNGFLVLFEPDLRNDRRIAIGGLLMLWAAISMFEAGWSANLIGPASVTARISISVPFLAGPALWWVVQSMSANHYAPSSAEWLVHCLPAIVCLFFFTPDAGWALTLCGARLCDDPLSLTDQHALRKLFTYGLFLCYCLAAVHRLHRRATSYRQLFGSDPKIRNRALLTYFIVGAFWTSFVIEFAAYPFGYANRLSVNPFNALGGMIRVFAAVVLALVVSRVGLVGLIGADTSDEQQAEREHRYGRARISAEQAAAHARDIAELMRSEQLFLNPLISLDMLARRANLRPGEVSQVLNLHLGTTFFDYVNVLRIERAKELLLRDLKRAVTDIAVDVGYNSRSTFYTAFKSVCDCTPSEFRRRMLKTRSI